MNRQGRTLVGVFVFGLLLGTPSGARANDTMATVGAGGLRFEQTAELKMALEELYLSPREIRVRYLFNNLTDHDVSGTVAFPLPEISVAEMSEQPHEFHKSYLDGDIFDFHVEVEGRLVTPSADIHAFVTDEQGREKDITDLLKKYKLPVVDPEASYRTLTPEAIKELVAAGVLEDDDIHHPLGPSERRSIGSRRFRRVARR